MAIGDTRRWFSENGCPSGSVFAEAKDDSHKYRKNKDYRRGFGGT